MFAWKIWYYLTELNISSTTAMFSEPLAAKQVRATVDPPPCLTDGQVFFY